MKKVIVIGGGIIGLCSAYYLRKEGYSVTVIEKGDLTKGASNINAGFIAPSHILSLASPGMINKGLKMMRNKSSPFYIKPRWDPEFFNWAWKFRKSSTKFRVERSIPILKELLSESQRLYEELLDSVEFQPHYDKKGLLSVFASRKCEKEEIEKGKKIENKGVKVNFLSRDEILDLQPSLSDKTAGAVHYVNNSHTTPNHFMKNFYQYLLKMGVEINLEEEVTEIKTGDNKILGIQTSKSFYDGDEFVLSAGSWSSNFAKKLGLNLTLQGGKGYSIDSFTANKISIPTILTEAKVAVTPMDGFTRFAGTMEFSGQNEIIRSERVSAIKKAAQSYYKDVNITDKEMKNVRSGLRPVSPDGLPYMGKSHTYQNMTIATGHAMIGWSLGPITGKLVSQLISEKEPSIKLEPFSLYRKF